MEANMESNEASESVQEIAVEDSAITDSTNSDGAAAIDTLAAETTSGIPEIEIDVADQTGAIDHEIGDQVEIMESDKNETAPVVDVNKSPSDLMTIDQQALMIDEGSSSPDLVEPSDPPIEQVEQAVDDNGNFETLREIGSTQEAPACSSTDVSKNQLQNHTDNKSPLPQEDVDDDDVIVVESRINTPGTSRLTPSATVAESAHIPVSENVDASLPQLMKSVGADSSGVMGAISTTAMASSPTTTPAAAVLKALAIGQAVSSGSGLKSPPLLTPSSFSVAKTVVPAIPPMTTASTAASSATVHSQNGSRYLQPNPPSFVNSDNAIPSHGFASHSRLRPPAPAAVNFCNSISPPNYTSQYKDGLPSYLKTVLDPASVIPYRSEVLPKEFGFLTPEGGYRCEECGDSFALKSCLEFHLQRRSMIIECSCVVCRQPYVFFNKCIYYGHIRQHSGNQRHVGKLVMRNVNVKPITWQLMEMAFEDSAFKRMSNVEEFFKYEAGTPMTAFGTDDQLLSASGKGSTTPAGTNKNKTVAAASNLAAKLYSAASSGTPMDDSLSAPVCCSECGQVCGSPSLLRQHFMYNLPVNQKQLICSSCQAVYFSHCSFKAHTRTHTVDSPFTCPECGVVEATHALLSKHLLTHQQNPTVMDAWRCQKCLTFYSSWEALIVHIGAAHCDSYYRCQHCPMAFQSAPAFQEHLETQHEDLNAIRATDAQLLTKCCQCDVVYMAREPLLEHLKTHFQKLLPFVVFRCALCGRLMENRGGLLGHFRNVHRLNVSSSDVTPVKIKVTASAPPTTAKKPTLVEGPSVPTTLLGCPQCPKVAFDSIASVKAHVKRVHEDGSESDATAVKKRKSGEKDAVGAASTSTTRQQQFTCRLCKEKFPDKEKLVEHGQRHIRNGSYVCLLCENNDCGSTVLLSHHLQRHMEMQRVRTSKNFSCEGHCDKNFSSAVAALDHYRNVHSLPPLRCFTCAINFPSENELRQHMRCHNAEASQHSGNTDSASSARSPELALIDHIEPRRSLSSGSDATKQRSDASTDSANKIRCNKCDVAIQDIESMHAHAVSHKESKYYLCLECGLSFAATSSLGRHLIVAHKISNVDKYLQDYPNANPDKPELECSVCHVEFSSKSLLDSHVRTHGLLFLKTKARPST